MQNTKQNNEETDILRTLIAPEGCAPCRAAVIEENLRLLQECESGDQIVPRSIGATMQDFRELEVHGLVLKSKIATGPRYPNLSLGEVIRKTAYTITAAGLDALRAYYEAPEAPAPVEAPKPAAVSSHRRRVALEAVASYCDLTNTNFLFFATDENAAALEALEACADAGLLERCASTTTRKEYALTAAGREALRLASVFKARKRDNADARTKVDAAELATVIAEKAEQATYEARREAHEALIDAVQG